MIKKIFTSLILAIMLIPGIYAQQDKRTLETKVADVLTQIPTNDLIHKDKLMLEMLNLGEEGIIEFTKLLVPPGEGDDTNVRFALGSLSKFLSNHYDNGRRHEIALAFVKAINTFEDIQLKSFLVHQLKFFGGEEVVLPLEKYLSHEKMIEPVTQLFITIGGEQVEEFFLTALKKAEGKSQITLVKALGDIKSKKAVRKIKKFVNTEDINLKKVSLFALANIADPKTENILKAEAEKVQFKFDWTGATAAYLEFARNIGKAGEVVSAENILKGLIQNLNNEDQISVKTRALLCWYEISGENVFPVLIDAIDNPNKEYRESALFVAQKFKGVTATNTWIKKFEEGDDAVKAEIIEMLGNRRDASAFDFLIQQMNHKNKNISGKAIIASIKTGEEQAVNPILQFMANTSDEGIINTCKEALLYTKSLKIASLINQQISKMQAPAKAACIDILAAKQAKEYFQLAFNETKSKHAALRKSSFLALEPLAGMDHMNMLFDLLNKVNDESEVIAVQKAILAAFGNIQNNDAKTNRILQQIENLENDQKIKYYNILAGVSGSKAIETVLAEFNSKDSQLKTEAFKALLNWSDIMATKALLEIAKTSADVNYKQEAFDAYLNQVAKSNEANDQKLLMYRELMPLTSSEDGKNRIVEEIGKLSGFTAFMYISQFIDTPALEQKAARALMALALPKGGAKVGLYGDLVKEQLKKAADCLKGFESEYERERINKYLTDMPQEKGFFKLFNGENLEGWKGLVGNPISRAKMSEEELQAEQKKANKRMAKNWTVEDGVIKFNGHGNNLCTEKKYGDFEMLVDWKILPKGDAGIYLRGTPQVQIWDTSRVEVGAQVGSGGLYNNAIGESKPLVVADNEVGTWNTFRILMTGSTVSVYLNGQLVVDDVVLENYWDRKKPIFPMEQIELQAHGTVLYFRDVYLREISRVNPNILSPEEKEAGFVQLFDGDDLDHWVGNKTDYVVEDGNIAIYPEHGGKGNLYTEKEYADFNFRFEFLLTPGANNGLGIRAPLEGDAAYVGMELQILDNTAQIYKNLNVYQYHGSVYGVIPAKRGYLKPVGEWNTEEVIVKGDHIKVILNGVPIVDGSIADAKENGTLDHRDHPGLHNKKGHIGFLGHGSVVKFRNIRILDLSK